MGMLGNSAGGGTSFNPAAPGPIGGTTPAAITGTVITATTKFVVPSGSVSAPGIGFADEAGTGIYRRFSTGISFAITGSNVMEVAGNLKQLRIPADYLYGFNNVAGNAANAADTALGRNAAGVVEINSGTAGVLRDLMLRAANLYSTFTDTSNYERLALKGTAGTKVTVAAETAGTGADNLDLELVPAGTGVVQFSNPQNGAAAATGTLTNAPTAGDPAEWLKVKVGANVRYIPCWA